MNRNYGRNKAAAPSTSYYHERLDRRREGYNPKSNDLPCSFNVNFENRDMSLEYLRNKMEDMEPRVSGIGGKLQKVTEDVEKLRELITARRREIEDLESSVTKRVNKDEDQLAACMQEFSDHRTETLAIRQSLTNIGSEIACLKNWVMDNMRGITSRLEVQDQQFLAFRNDLLKRVDRTIREAARAEMRELRYQVDAKFAAVKVALKKSGKGDLELSQLDEPLFDEAPDKIDITVTPVEDLLDSEFGTDPYAGHEADYMGGFNKQYQYSEPIADQPRVSKKKCCKTVGSTRKCCKKGSRSRVRSESLDSSSQPVRTVINEPRTVVIEPPGGTVFVEPDRGTVVVEPMVEPTPYAPVNNSAALTSRRETGEILAEILVQPATGEITDITMARKSSTKKPCPYPPRKKQSAPKNSIPAEVSPRYTEVFMDAEAVLNELRKHSIT